MKKNIPAAVKWFDRLPARLKLLFSIGIGIVISLILVFTGLQILSCIMIGWDGFCLCLILITWLTFFYTESSDLSQQAKNQDESRHTTFLIVLFSVLASIVGIIFILNNKDENLVHKQMNTIISMSGVALSWFLLHTTFTLRYAHLYYVQTLSAETDKKGGIDFPGGNKKPDYFDFAYFSFVIGMTFQVSDVQVTSPKIRRVVLLHGLIAFVFNTIIVALTISILAGLSEK